MRLTCWYAPQSVGSLVHKLSFYDELKTKLDMHGVDDLRICSFDFNGHVGRHIDGYDGPRGVYGVGQSNLEG